MFFKWLKRYMPRGIYARAALIIVLPVFLLQVVVSFQLVRRHFEGVTNQMTFAAAREVQLIINLVEDPDLEAGVVPSVLDGLDMTLTTHKTLDAKDSRLWYDFTGIIIMRVLREQLPQLRAVQLADDKVVRLFLQTKPTAISVEFERRRASASNSHQLIVSMVFFGIILTIVAYLYMRNQLRPIKRLAAAAEAFGRGRTVPYSPGGAIEIRAAGSAFLDMRNRIERFFEQRTLMLSGISHDLRTPLTRLKLGLSMIDDDDRADLEKDVEEMQRMIDAFLDYTRSDYEDQRTKVNAADFVRDIVDGCARAGQNVILYKIKGDGDISFSTDTVRRAVENLIGNAVRYGNHAEVSVRITDKSVRIRVEDDGPGIASQDREEAIKPFARLEPARNQNKGPGVGLGLSIAADVARAHGGVLRLGESERLGGLRADLVFGL
ncbi:Osmolarity sensor protein EnvZ [Shimia sp. SK013]|uniref:ATP-binding protein n=1 Tax=Shimia sp. SK013 TaxID=1389006 RepID=UPI0006B5B0C0|nr:ATP-binding protein [Shimia sp. SK013]KPA22446.1 Osmolarity sensor protein EnvZ [Shimia sp. SK013]